MQTLGKFKVSHMELLEDVWSATSRDHDTGSLQQKTFNCKFFTETSVDLDVTCDFLKGTWPSFYYMLA